MSQSPTIFIPFKRTDEVDLGTPLKRHIAQIYQEDPEKYNEEIGYIQRLRQDMRGAGEDATGRDILYKYFCQLELLELRFPIDENHIKILFTWYDAFTRHGTSQYSLAFEKASVIFNIGAVLSAIASQQNRSEADGLKCAYHYFQYAAGMFQYINDNFLHAPSLDLNRDTLKLLVQLMLAQAQECFFERSVNEKKKHAFLAKLAAQAAWSYGAAVEGLNEGLSKGVFDRSWLSMCQTKNKMFLALAHYHRAVACEAENKYGEMVSRFTIGETNAKEAVKLCGQLVGTFGPTICPGMVLDAGVGLMEITKSLLAMLTEKKNTAVRDNDLVYHDVVPSESILPAIDKLNAVKALPISELYNQQETQRVVGADIFARLIPLSVHESSSLYSEEKAKLVRGETEKCDLAENELQSALEYMKLPGILEKFKRTINEHSGSLDEFATPTSDARDWADRIRADEEQNGNVYELIETLDGLKSRVRELLDVIGINLDEEQRACEAMRVKYGDRWTQAPSGSLTSAFRQDLRTHREALEQANLSDRQLQHKYESIVQDVSVLRGGADGDDLGRIFAEAMVGVDQSTPGQSLLDLDEGDDPREAIREKLEMINESMSKLKKISKERADTLADLKDKAQRDDISHILVLNRKQNNVEPHIFAQELEKFRPYQARIAQTIHLQETSIQELTSAYKALMTADASKSVTNRWQSAEKKRRAVVDRLSKAKDYYFEVKNGLAKGIQFYSDLTDLVEALLKNVREFVKARAEERNRLVQKEESDKLERDRRMLQEALNKYSSGPSAPTLPPLYASVDAAINQLTDNAKRMSLADMSSRQISNSPPPFNPHHYQHEKASPAKTSRSWSTPVQNPQPPSATFSAPHSSHQSYASPAPSNDQGSRPAQQGSIAEAPLSSIPPQAPYAPASTLASRPSGQQATITSPHGPTLPSSSPAKSTPMAPADPAPVSNWGTTSSTATQAPPPQNIYGSSHPQSYEYPPSQQRQQTNYSAPQVPQTPHAPQPQQVAWSAQNYTPPPPVSTVAPAPATHPSVINPHQPDHSAGYSQQQYPQQMPPALSHSASQVPASTYSTYPQERQPTAAKPEARLSTVQDPVRPPYYQASQAPSQGISPAPTSQSPYVPSQSQPSGHYPTSYQQPPPPPQPQPQPQYGYQPMPPQHQTQQNFLPRPPSQPPSSQPYTPQPPPLQSPQPDPILGPRPAPPLPPKHPSVYEQRQPMTYQQPQQGPYPQPSLPPAQTPQSISQPNYPPPAQPPYYPGPPQHGSSPMYGSRPGPPLPPKHPSAYEPSFSSTPQQQAAPPPPPTQYQQPHQQAQSQMPYQPYPPQPPHQPSPHTPHGYPHQPAPLRQHSYPPVRPPTSDPAAYGPQPPLQPTPQYGYSNPAPGYHGQQLPQPQPTNWRQEPPHPPQQTYQQMPPGGYQPGGPSLMD
ncbi:uncharacterized protein VTP21DRAFT_2062 [Calcarisporiella thermophila]|uniref:uncharacterized protein n=1 Tax=Calcarisporiella thermophila TaxID=911321 RepID=UPI0037433F2A